jgi:hypothetical protein
MIFPARARVAGNSNAQVGEDVDEALNDPGGKRGAGLGGKNSAINPVACFTEFPGVCLLMERPYQSTGAGGQGRDFRGGDRGISERLAQFLNELGELLLRVGPDVMRSAQQLCEGGKVGLEFGLRRRSIGWLIRHDAWSLPKECF